MEEQNEWTRYTINLPADDYDEDEAIDEVIAERQRRKKKRIDRGKGLFGV